jgi:hypothetical protein
LLIVVVVMVFTCVYTSIRTWTTVYTWACGHHR